MGIDIRDLLILSTIPGIGPTRLRALLGHFKDARAIAEASAKELVAVEGIEKKRALTIVEFFRNSGLTAAERSADDQLRRVNKLDAEIIPFWDKRFPAPLKKIYDAPAFLYVRGQLEPIDNSSVAIVGTRTPTPYGRQVAEEFAAGFARLGITVVSGLARGIDTYAHSCALKGGGRTVAVIGSGIDVIYPPENKPLAERIVDRGAVISEFPMGAKPDAVNFPRRNRIISGMTLGTIVVETGVDGGAMITAAMALDQNREVFAIPARVNEKRKSGSNLLIKESKALLVESVDDVVSALRSHFKHLVAGHDPAARVPTPELSMFEQKLFDALDNEPLHIDVLSNRSGLSTPDTLVQLLSLEFKGLVKQLPGKMFVRT